MGAIQNVFAQLSIQWYDYIDILIVTYLIYRLVPLVRSSGSIRIVGMIAALLVATPVTGVLKLNALHYVLQKISDVGVVAIVVLYQPELRQASPSQGWCLPEYWSSRSPSGFCNTSWHRP